MPEPQPGHWLERGPQKRLMVFSGRSHPELAQRIAEHLGVELGEIELETFANGETYCRYGESIRGADVFLVQTGCDPVDRNLMELLLMIQAAKLGVREAHHRRHPVVPVLAPGPQGEAARADLRRACVADMLQLAGADRVLTMDLHAGQIQGFFNIPVDHMTALPLFAQHFRDLGLTGPRGRLGRAGCRPREVRGPLRGDDRRRLRDHAQDAAGARHRRDHRDHRPRRRQDRASSATT